MGRKWLFTFASVCLSLLIESVPFPHIPADCLMHRSWNIPCLVRPFAVPSWWFAWPLPEAENLVILICLGFSQLSFAFLFCSGTTSFFSYGGISYFALTQINHRLLKPKEIMGAFDTIKIKAFSHHKLMFSSATFVILC